ncbi:C2 family cysteine protease [Humisphaera borealis]|uniref:Calpain catalytic domain-containing protein n=1 Tax=Humisphaera borealis TaxID=2807512 RepID=A0A7M2WY31_9BACT|nr:C2 family cysteine protease [Humisphaera borealis]QOV90385.1 hypothetical protein IPV69_03185 [Humisphaera borealis]
MRSEIRCERLESRRLLSAVSAAFDPSVGLLTVTGTENADQIVLRRTVAGTLPSSQKLDVLVGKPARVVFSVRFDAVKQITVNAGGGNDCVSTAGTASDFVNQPMTFNGGSGNDTLKAAASKTATIWGGTGNDTLIGGSNADALSGDAGNDWIVGGGGDDKLFGVDGDDYLNGGAGKDVMLGGNGNDTFVAIDACTSDVLTGGPGNDIVWADRGTGAARDIVSDASAYEAARTVRLVTSFANRVDKTLDGDRVVDPVTDVSYRSFAGRPLFGPGGPTASDITQGSSANCWLLGQLGAVAQAAPLTVRATVVDLADGTFAVALGGSFYRVDADLPVQADGATPQFARTGTGGSLWVAIVEKAYATHRFAIANGDYRGNYEDLCYGDPNELLTAVRATNMGWNYHPENSGVAFANELFTQWNARKAVAFSTGPCAIEGLVAQHTYTVTSVTRDTAGRVTSLCLRNPWGGASPFVDVTPQKLAGMEFWLTWGDVGAA